MNAKDLNEAIKRAKNQEVEYIYKLFDHYEYKILRIIEYYMTKYNTGIVDEDDLRQACYMGILKCLESDSSFTHVVDFYITNACRKEIFDNQSTIRIPQNLFHNRKELALEYLDKMQTISIDEVLEELLYSDEYIVDNLYNSNLLKMIRPLLTEREYNIMCLKYIDEKTYREIGEIYGLSINRVSQLLYKVQVKLRRNQYKFSI